MGGGGNIHPGLTKRENYLFATILKEKKIFVSLCLRHAKCLKFQFSIPWILANKYRKKEAWINDTPELFFKVK